MSELISKHTVSVLVDNEPGVLARVIGLISGRGYNIDSLTVAEVDAEKHISRITIVAPGTDCLLYTSPSPRDGRISRMPSSA